jgi:hypothetical protein
VFRGGGMDAAALIKFSDFIAHNVPAVYDDWGG